MVVLASPKMCATAGAERNVVRSGSSAASELANLRIVDFLLFETIAEACGHRGQTDVAAWWNEMGAAAALSFHSVAAVRFYG